MSNKVNLQGSGCDSRAKCATHEGPDKVKFFLVRGEMGVNCLDLQSFSHGD